MKGRRLAVGTPSASTSATSQVGAHGVEQLTKKLQELIRTMSCERAEFALEKAASGERLANRSICRRPSEGRLLHDGVDMPPWLVD